MAERRLQSMTSDNRDQSASRTIGLFVTGTDTGVGKTYLAALIARQLRSEGVSVGVYKPACSGSRVLPDGRQAWDDVEAHFEALGGLHPRERICPQCFRAPLAPPAAARAEGRTVDAPLLRTGADWWRGRVDALLVEGAGGLLSPLSDADAVADVACDLGFPLLIVARLGLGTINHTLLTLEAAERRGLMVAGVVLNRAPGDPSSLADETNPAELAARTRVPILGVLRTDETGGLRPASQDIRIRWLDLMREPGPVQPRHDR